MREFNKRAGVVGLTTALLLGGSVVALAQELELAPASVVAYTIELTGANEVPAVTTAGSGTAQVIYDPATMMLNWTVTYAGLSSPITGAHFHGPAGPAANAGVIIDMGGALGSPIMGEAVLDADMAAMLDAGEVYINIHTEANPGGEIRGQLGFTPDLMRELQTLLTQRGFDPQGIDGIFGPLTEAAVTAAQQSLGLPVTGQPTLSLLLRLREGGVAPAPAPVPVPGTEVGLPPLL